MYGASGHDDVEDLTCESITQKLTYLMWYWSEAW